MFNQNANLSSQEQPPQQRQAQWDAEGDLTGFLPAGAIPLHPSQQPQGPAPSGTPNGQGAPISPGQQYASQQLQPQPWQPQQFQQPGAAQDQMPPLPAIEIPAGYALAGRYNNLQDLERHAAHFQSVADRTRNEAGEALQIKQILDQNPDLYEVLAQRLEGQPGSVGGQSGGGNDLGDVIVTDPETGAQRVDPGKLAGLVQGMVRQQVQPIQQQLGQQVGRAELVNRYTQMGLSQQELEADLAYSRQLAGLPEDQLLLLSRQLRLGMTAQQPPMQQGMPQQPVYQPPMIPQTPAVPRTVTSIGGFQPAPQKSPGEQQADAIAGFGRRSLNSLFPQR